MEQTPNRQTPSRGRPAEMVLENDVLIKNNLRQCHHHCRRLTQGQPTPPPPPSSSSSSLSSLYSKTSVILISIVFLLMCIFAPEVSAEQEILIVDQFDGNFTEYHLDLDAGSNNNNNNNNNEDHNTEKSSFRKNLTPVIGEHDPHLKNVTFQTGTGIVKHDRENTKLYKLTLLHSNDFHTRFIPIDSRNNAQCSLQIEQHQKCVGGAARTVALVKEYRKKYSESFLFLNAGDHFQGTFWYTLNRSEVVAHFVGRMEQDEMALGNHEFDDGEIELRKFINIMEAYKPNFKFLCANIILKPDSVLNGKIKPSTVRIVNGRKMAIIGYVTPETAYLSSPGKKVLFTDEIYAIREEIKRIKSQDPSVNIFIALGHSGLKRDLDLAYNIPELDLVVGGHSHTFLWDKSIAAPNIYDVAAREYPVVIHNNGSTTLVVQAFAYGKYMGHLDVSFDDAGHIRHYTGYPIYMNGTEDSETADFLKSSITEIGSKIDEKIGETTKELDNGGCRSRECEIGNLITDAIEYVYNNRSKNVHDSECNNIYAIFNGGSIRSSVSAGIITQKDVLDALPYDNVLGLTKVYAKQLWAIFEHSAEQYDLGGFLQMSNNIRVLYRYGWDADTAILLDVELRCNNKWRSLKTFLNKGRKLRNKDRKSYVAHVEPKNINSGNVVHYKTRADVDSNDEDDYSFIIATTSYIFNGGDNFQMFNTSIWNPSKHTTRTAFIAYLNNRTITPELDGRIVFGAFHTGSSAPALFSFRLGFWVSVISALNFMLFNRQLF